eukprot:1151996-Pelagomonas_calceolata.AAC.1
MGGCDAARQKGGAVSNVCHACSANECTYPGSAQHAPAVPKSLIIDMSCTFPAAAAPCKAAASFPWHARGKGQPCPCGCIRRSRCVCLAGAYQLEQARVHSRGVLARAGACVCLAGAYELEQVRAPSRGVLARAGVHRLEQEIDVETDTISFVLITVDVPTSFICAYDLNMSALDGMLPSSLFNPLRSFVGEGEEQVLVRVVSLLIAIGGTLITALLLGIISGKNVCACWFIYG